MDLCLESKSVLITGSSRGIGYAIAKGFLKEGAKVTITGRNKETLSESAGNLKRIYGDDSTHSICADLTDIDAIEHTIKDASAHWGGIDILILNLGTGASVTGWDIGDAEWSRMMDINLRSAINVVENALHHMINRGSGSITFITSIAGNEVVKAPLPYSVAKTAVNAYMKNLAWQLGDKNIRVNAVSPGNVIFPGGTWDRKMKENSAFVEEYIAKEVPLARLATPEEIADLVIFISSERCSFMTGSCVVSDGGQTRGGVY